MSQYILPLRIQVRITSSSLTACATGITMTSTSDAYRARRSSRCHPNILLVAEVHLVKLIGDSEHATNETERLSQISATQQVQLQRCTPVGQAVCE
jgi:hypothetical protein